MAKFCSNCGAALKADSVFCEECGMRVDAAPEVIIPPATDNGSVFTGFTPSSGTGGAFEKTKTMLEAAEIAISRNAQGKWCYWDAPGKYRNAAWNLKTFAEKEDKRLNKLDDHEGVLYYVVSPAGSVGHVYEDMYVYDDHRLILEWVFYAPGEGEETLPSAPEQL